MELLLGPGAVASARGPSLTRRHRPPPRPRRRCQVIPSREVLCAFLEFVYTDDVQEHRVSHHLHMAAIQCRMPRLVALCEARLAQRIEQEVAAWGGYSPQQQQSCADFVLDWIRWAGLQLAWRGARCSAARGSSGRAGSRRAGLRPRRCAGALVLRGAGADAACLWCRYCERLQREDLKDFCCHLISRHYSAACARPNWRKLQPATLQLVEALAHSSVQPVVERQVVSSRGAACVRLESDLYAKAGGRLNEGEWEQLQRYRDACATAAAQLPSSCPLVMSPQELYDCESPCSVSLRAFSPVLGLPAGTRLPAPPA
jgi:hypothetical protein